MGDKYEVGSILEYDNGDKFVVCERIKDNTVQYLLVMRLDEEIKEKLVIDYKKLLMIKVLANDESVIEEDENVVRRIYNQMLEKGKLEIQKRKK